MTKELTRAEESILRSLIGKELYGVQIAHAINKASGRCLYGKNILYTALGRLEKKGFVSFRLATIYERIEDKGGNTRKYYSLTDTGAEELDNLNRFTKELMMWQPDETGDVPLIKKAC